MMKVARVTKIGKTFEEALSYIEIDNIPIPEPRPYQVLIKVKAAALNFLDTLVIQNKYQVKYTAPFTPGSELSGVIIKIGSKITHVKPGDRVISNPDYPNGGFGEYTLSHAKDVWRIPDNMSFIDAAGFIVTYGTAYMALIQRANLLTHKLPKGTPTMPKNIENGCNILVTAGAGGLGTACIQVANAFKKQGNKNINKIIACVGNTQFNKKEEIVKKCGADLVINYHNNPKWGKELKKKNIGVDIICDMVGGTAFDQSLKCINWYGKLLVLGFAGGNIPKLKVNRVLLKSCDIIGCAFGATSFVDFQDYRDAVRDALILYSKGYLKPIVGKVYKFDKNGVKQALMDLGMRRSVGKLIVDIDSNSNSTIAKSKL